MKFRLFLALVCLTTVAAQAAPPEFSEKLVIAPKRAGVFHHLDSAGRQHVAVSGNRVAVVWEDNREGRPQVFLTVKAIAEARFPGTMKVSGSKPATDPVIVPLANGQFLLAWEEGGTLRLRHLGATGLGPIVPLPDKNAGQASITRDGEGAMLAYVYTPARFSQVVTRTLRIDRTGKITAGPVVPIERDAPKDDQIAPVIASTRTGVVVAWEDRRQGHTILLYSHTDNRKTFSKPALLNEQVRKSDVYGRGSGVTRVAITNWGTNELAAAWMDKRGFRTGYDIFGAVSSQGGKQFGKNEQIQDSFGNEIPQWHAAIAGNTRGDLVAAFDDSRDESADIHLSIRSRDGAWSDNFSPAVASGAGEQSHPALALDAEGGIHLVWLERESVGAPTRLLYSHGRPQS